jgi:hypothetical protein
MDDFDLVSNLVVFGPGPGQILWFFMVWSAVNLWFLIVYLPMRAQGRK